MKFGSYLFGLAAALAGPAMAAQARAPAPAPVQPQGQAAPAPPAAPPVQYPTRVSVKQLTAVCGENGAACLTYVLGVVDSYVTTSIANFGRPHVCVPPQVSNQQVANTAIAYLRAHPGAPDANAAIPVILGVQAAYPCAQATPPH
ncbi:MAG: Rap1a immunity protein [Alphaproteobacteria bacterium]|nr:Rap1a immunity protein [Alphaproteobacteria bacterium]